MYPKKSLGQNFLNDKKILSKIVDVADIKPNDVILEIGPGTGNLTDEIIKKSPSAVTVVEKDKKLSDLVDEIPRLSTKGTRRALVTTFSDLFIDAVPIAMDESLGEKWNRGPSVSSRWHPEGACLRFRFSLSSGSYATTLLREFMQCPLNQL